MGQVLLDQRLEHVRRHPQEVGAEHIRDELVADDHGGRAPRIDLAQRHEERRRQRLDRLGDDGQLEPIGELKVLIPDGNMGDVIGDLNKRRGRIMGMNPLDGGKQEIVAECPMAELGDYAIKLRSMTQGRGSFVSKFERYDEAPAPVQEKVIAENKARMEALNKD